MPLFLRLAWREMRGGMKGFRVLVACLALGVAAIAASGSLRAAVDRALAEDARALLGGDLDLRQSHQPATEEQRRVLGGLGRITEGIEMRVLARGPGNRDRALVELKGVDAAYPLVGRMELDPPLSDPFAFRDGAWGAVAEVNLLERLGLMIGDGIEVGETSFRITAVIGKEPDRVATALSFGPRLMASNDAVRATGLIQPGSLVRHTLRLALQDSTGIRDAKALLAARFPDAPWQMRDTTEAAPGVGRFLDTLAAFLSLVGLTALLVGGIGVANAVRAAMDKRLTTIATLKSLGASSRLILLTYLALLGAMALCGILTGLAIGASAVPLTEALLGPSMPLPFRSGLYPTPLAIAAGFGLLAALVFTLWPLGRARLTPAATLFRSTAAPLHGRPDSLTIAAVILSGAALAALAVLTSGNRPLAAWFVGAALATLAMFRLLGWSVAKTAASLRDENRTSHPVRRLTLAALNRPDGGTMGLVVSLGLGLSVLVTIIQVEANLAAQFGERLPRRAPSAYFIDVQPHQIEALGRTVALADPDAALETASMVRGRITAIGGVPVDQANIAPEVQWAARGDRGLSTAARMPEGTRLVAGQWWPETYGGPPLVSVDAAVAKGFGLKVGDGLGLNILGRDMTVRVASLRQIEWTSLSMNFALLLSPGALDGAPYTVIATLKGTPSREAAVEKAVTDALSNVSVIRVKEALESVRAIIGQAELAVRLAGLVTLAAGVMVLAGAILAGHDRRVREAVILKVLGASAPVLWRAHLAEFAVLGLVTGLGAALVGTLAARAILLYVMKTEWVFLPGPALLTLTLGLVASMMGGFLGTYRALRAKTAPLLRNDE